MKLTARLALSQIKENRNRSIMTLIGIALSSAMLTAVFGFVTSGKATLDRAVGYDYSNQNYNASFIIIGAILGAVIIAASVIVVSNAFRISAGERTRQFGILKSVGATKKQIAESVLYEGVLLSLIGIPIGLIVGLLIEWIGTTVVTELLHSMSDGGTLQVDSPEFLTIDFTVSAFMFLVAIITSFGTVLLSAWLPARKAAKIPAIEAIRSTGEIQLKRKNMRTSKMTQRLFGFEGTLAEKALKRNRRNLRATTISLTISVILLIVSGSFGTMMKQMTDAAFPDFDATVEAFWASDIKTGADGQSAEYLTINDETTDAITSELSSYADTEIFGVGGNAGYTVILPNGKKASGALVATDETHYEQLCEEAHVPIGSSMLVNLRQEKVDGKRKSYEPYKFADFADETLTFSQKGHEPIEVPISGELTGESVPPEVLGMYDSDLVVVVPECEASNYRWYATVDDTAGFTTFGKQVLTELAPQSKDGISASAECVSIADATKQMNDMANTIMYFVYGFVGMLTLIAITSVVSTINTNIRSRAREFAVLESVGMTKSGIKKMLNLESVLCSMKSLMFGIPLGLLGAVVMYFGMSISMELSFQFPWVPIVECIVGVFAVTWISMRYAASRMKNESIVETIRGE